MNDIDLCQRQVSGLQWQLKSHIAVNMLLGIIIIVLVFLNFFTTRPRHVQQEALINRTLIQQNQQAIKEIAENVTATNDYISAMLKHLENQNK